MIEKKQMGIMTCKQHLCFNAISNQNLNTCPTVSQVPGNLRRKILLVAVGTTGTLVFQPRHRQESVPPIDVVLEGCLTWLAMFTVHGQHFFVDILCCRTFGPQKPHNATLFYHGTHIHGRRHLVTAAPSLVMRIPIVARHKKTRQCCHLAMTFSRT